MPEPDDPPAAADGSAARADDNADAASASLPPSLIPPAADRGELVVRHPGADDEDLNRAVVNASFGDPFRPQSSQDRSDWAALVPLTNRLLVAERALQGRERVLGGAGRLDTALSLPGGSRVPAAALTGVGVAPGAQGRGAFRALVDAHLDEARERGDAASVLMASQTQLYGRFGYGCATQAASWEIDVPTAGRLQTNAPTSGRVDLEHGRGQPLTDLLHQTWEAAGGRRAGSLTRSPAWWARVVAPARSWMGGGDLLVGLHWTHEGRCDGYVLYDVDSEHGRQALAESTITIRELVAVDVAAELDLWRFVANLPWGRLIKWPYGPIDPAALFWLEDSRALRRMWQADFLWLRPLDLDAMTRGRSFAADGRIALDVADPRYPAFAGRFDLVTRDGHGEWERGSGPPELELSAGDLGALWLGDVSALRMLGVRRISGDPRAASLMDAMLAVGAAPRSLARF